MKEIKKLNEIQELELNILISFDKFCRKNDLKYSLMGGTMLGAVRHKGFIPWDDDIDISMPRPDYEKFVKLTKNGMSDNYRVYCINTKRDYIYPFTKIIDDRTILYEKNIKPKYNLGIYIDIFPVDGFPPSENQAIKHYKKITRLKKYTIWGASKLDKNQHIIKRSLKFIREFIFKIIGAPYFAKRRDEAFRQFDFDESEYVTLSTGYALKTKMQKEEYLNLIDVEFCGNVFKCSANYHETLTNIYGDYMQLPPKNEQVSNHDYKLYWK
ncbi:LicD family protein [Lysinibacillus xylanilyticus]|uniref:LicD family protein n=1 Tax=Lysinibacillus xylanilyticus TaxID=582475 RepID=UPI003803CDE7